jgi:hypothetical protein
MPVRTHRSLQTPIPQAREYWLSVLQRLSEPLLRVAAAGDLKSAMPIEAHPKSIGRGEYTHLEAVGRLLAGIAPWLELDLPQDSAERQLQQTNRQLARAAVARICHPTEPAGLNFDRGGQPVVDAAFLAQAVLRAPTQLWEKLPAPAQKNLANALAKTRSILPGFNNWLLFSGTIEAALHRMGQWWDPMRVDYALRQHEAWYAGDGCYNDGPAFHFDYYNSFVIQPMLLDIVAELLPCGGGKLTPEFAQQLLRRCQRYAEILERLISPEGTLPPVGRSLAYRFGILQPLGHLALRGDLPESLPPAQVRSAMNAVIRRMAEAPGTFDSDGWLRIGFCGAQPEVGEPYISTGSLYLCSTGLLPLGLPPAAPFWTGPESDWTARRAWSGQAIPADKAQA